MTVTANKNTEKKFIYWINYKTVALLTWATLLNRCRTPCSCRTPWCWPDLVPLRWLWLGAYTWTFCQYLPSTLSCTHPCCCPSLHTVLHNCTHLLSLHTTPYTLILMSTQEIFTYIRHPTSLLGRACPPCIRVLTAEAAARVHPDSIIALIPVILQQSHSKPL